MEKPVVIKKREFEQKLNTCIVESNIPAFVIVSVLEKTLNNMKDIEEQEYNMNLETYTKACEEEKEKSDVDDQ